MKHKLPNIVEDPDNHLGYLAQDITRLLRAEVHRRLAKLGITRAQLNLLSHLFQIQGCTQRTLAEHLEIEPAPVGRMVDELEKAGWVERRRDPNDRRAWQLFIPESLVNTIVEIETHLGDIYDAALDGMSDRQVQTLFKGLSQLRKNIVAFAGQGAVVDPDQLTLPPQVRKHIARKQNG